MSKTEADLSFPPAHLHPLSEAGNNQTVVSLDLSQNDTEDEKQWRNTAYCLSLLPFKSEKSLKKLIDGLPFYQDKLREETVYNRFAEILAKVCRLVVRVNCVI